MRFLNLGLPKSSFSDFSFYLEEIAGKEKTGNVHKRKWVCISFSFSLFFSEGVGGISRPKPTVWRDSKAVRSSLTFPLFLLRRELRGLKKGTKNFFSELLL